MKEQGNFEGQNMSGSALNGEKISFLPEIDKSDEAKKIATRIFANLAPIGDELHFDGNVEINLGQLPKEPLKEILIESDKFEDEQKPFRPDGPVKKFFRKFAEVGSATAVLATVGSAIPAIAEEVPADVALGINTDEVRKAINSVATAEASPAPTAEVTALDEKYDEDRYSTYIQKVKDYGCTDDVVADVCGRFLYTRENYVENGDSLKNRVSEQQILDYSISGVADGFDVYTEDGKPMFLFAYNEDNPDSSVIDAFTKTINYIKDNGCPDIAKSIQGAGVNIFYVDFDGSGGAVLQDAGIVVIDSNCEEIKNKSNVVYYLSRIILTEPYGVALSNMMLSIGDLGNYFGIVEVGKSVLTSCESTYRYIKDSDNNYLNLGIEYTIAVDCFSELYETSVTDPYLIRQLYLLVNGGTDNCGLTKPMNLEPWSEIFNTLAVEVLGWDGVDITDEVKFGELISELHDKIPGFLGQ